MNAEEIFGHMTNVKEAYEEYAEARSVRWYTRGPEASRFEQVWLDFCKAIAATNAAQEETP